jgi:PBSX family phage portal protein
MALDYVVFGNMYGQKFTNRFGKVLRIAPLPGVNMRRGKKEGTFYQLKNDGSHIKFKQDEVIHIKEPDIKQSIYGTPEYLGGLQSVLLSEEAGLFRRKYYLNGAHMGYILVTNDADLDPASAQAIEAAVKKSKGPGNFRSLYLNIGRSNAKEPVKIIPVGDIATKDEFERIKNITRGEILSMHRMQPGLSGIMPDNTGGFGDLEKIMRVYHELEIGALQQPFLELNEVLGDNAVSFREPVWVGEVA